MRYLVELGWYLPSLALSLRLTGFQQCCSKFVWFLRELEPRPMLFVLQLSEKWLGGNLNQQVRILFLGWKKNICLVISQLKLCVDIAQFFFIIPIM